MEDKRKDLKSTRQRAIIERVVARLADSNPSFYYLSTIELAAEIQAWIRQSGNLNKDDSELVKNLRRRDIQLILGLHSEH